MKKLKYVGYSDSKVEELERERNHGFTPMKCACQNPEFGPKLQFTKMIFEKCKFKGINLPKHVLHLLHEPIYLILRLPYFNLL